MVHKRTDLHIGTIQLHHRFRGA